MTAGLLDYIDTPMQGNQPIEGVPWCADNGCFGKGYPGDGAWFGWLQRNAHRAASCQFAVAPDVVGDAAATLERSTPWLAAIRDLGYPVAFVGQNGVEHTSIPWDAVDVIFLGGSAECVPCRWVRPADDRDTKRCPGCNQWLNEWKLGDVARDLTADAKRRGKRVHMGRVNSEKRLRYALSIGCDSADGTYIKRGPDINLPKMLGFLRSVHQDQLFGAVS